MNAASGLEALWRQALEGARRCRLEVDSVSLADPAALAERLGALRGASGWICTTDAVEEWTGGMPERFLPLGAELFEDERTSWQLRQRGEGWVLTRLSETETGEVESADLAFDERFETSAPGRAGHAMRYRVYHRQDEQGVYRPFAARWLGWEERA